MKRFFLSLVTALTIAAAIQGFTIWSLSTNLPRAVGRPDLVDMRTLSLPAARHLRITNENGTVQVQAVSVAEITVEVSLRAYTRDDVPEHQVRQYLASLVRVHASAQALDIITEPDDRPEHMETAEHVDIRADYTVMVPEGTDIDVVGSNGNVWIAKGCGQVTVHGRNSDIEIVAPRGPVVADSTNGRIRVVDAPEGADIKTVNGNIYTHMLGGSLDAVTTNGAIVARMLDPRIKACNLVSQNGSITLIMSDGCSAAIDAVTERGNVKSDFQETTANGGSRKRRLHGAVGSGNTKVQIESLNGNIWVARSEL